MTPEQALNMIDGILSVITAIGDPGRGLTRHEQGNLQQAVILVRKALQPQPVDKPIPEADDG